MAMVHVQAMLVVMYFVCQSNAMGLLLMPTWRFGKAIYIIMPTRYLDGHMVTAVRRHGLEL